MKIMNLRLIVSLLFLLIVQNVNSENYPKLASNLIPTSLLSKADIVIRDNTINIIWNDFGELIIKKRLVVTIMNKDGMVKPLFHEMYDNDITIKKLRVIILDKFGNETKTIKKSNFFDSPIVMGLYSDSRYKYVEPISNTFPFTVILTSETKRNNTIYFPRWNPLKSNYTAVEHSKYTFSNPSGFKYNIDERNIKHTKTNSGDLVWEINNVKAQSPEKFRPYKSEYLPFVEIAPVNFKYEYIPGSFTNWNEYGRWIYRNLISGRNNLTQSQKDEILSLVEENDSDIEKAKKIYKHLQDKMRYVSVQVGIGGIQPISAKEVAECGYGDCKGLTNYTMSALEVVGVESIYTEVKSGEKKFDYNENFASVTQGDHIILCLPNLAKDTLWLECTSKDAPFGYLGNFTDDRKVLLITPDGGKITKTPSYSDIDNSISKTITAMIDENGEITGKSIANFSGNNYSNHLFVSNLSEKNKQVALDELYYNTMLVQNVEYDESVNLVLTEKINFSIPNENILIDNKSFSFNPYILKNRPVKIYRNRHRQSDVVIYRDYNEIDSITYNLPQHCKIEAMPSNIFIENDFGTYVRLVSKKDNKITYIRKFSLKKGRHSKDKYQEFYKFIRKVNRTNNSKIIMYL